MRCKVLHFFFYVYNANKVNQVNQPKIYVNNVNTVKAVNSVKEVNFVKGVDNVIIL